MQYLKGVALRCPDCKTGALDADGQGLRCGHCGSIFPLSADRPILLRRDNPLFEIEHYVAARPRAEGRTARNLVPRLSLNLAVSRIMPRMRALLDEQGPSKVLVVGGGSQRKWLEPMLHSSVGHTIFYSDIDTSADVDLFCDGHDLPFFNDVFDAVVTTAVLEHVLYPEQVAAEIARVLKVGGVLYSELPFMQQVHEGAYDFTRYTLSGHRRLFNQFREIEAGLVAGPATALVWSIENFILAFFGARRTRNVMKAFTRIAFSWIKYFDYLLKDRPQAMDGASCTFFFGRKSDTPVSDGEIIQAYIGAKHLSHV